MDSGGFLAIPGKYPNIIIDVSFTEMCPICVTCKIFHMLVIQWRGKLMKFNEEDLFVALFVHYHAYCLSGLCLVMSK